MSRSTVARGSLLLRGPYVPGAGEGPGKYGRGHDWCLFCADTFPFHREYCAWHDYFTTKGVSLVHDDGMNLVEEQPAPQPNQREPIWELVMADMRAKHEAGMAKYGTPLQANNGRDPLVDLYQELLDACAYIRQAIEERHG